MVTCSTGSWPSTGKHTSPPGTICVPPNNYKLHVVAATVTPQQHGTFLHLFFYCDPCRYLYMEEKVQEQLASDLGTTRTMILKNLNEIDESTCFF